jgi:acetamidase/formamidase
MSYDTAGTTVTGGTRVYSTVLSNAANVNVVLADLPFTLTAGDVLVASIESTASATVGVALTLVEDV